jgi:hypothetical protein
MEFTKEQFEEIGPWYFHDLCFDSSDQEVMRKIFNLLPSHLQGLAVSWDCDDSVFRDDVFVYLLKNQFDMTPEEYRESEIGKDFFENGTYQEVDFDKLTPKKISFDIETEGDITVVDEDGVVTTIPKYEGKNVLDKLLAQYPLDGYDKGELGIIMAPAGMGKTRKFNPSKGRYQEKIDAAIKANKKDKDA